MRDWKPQRLDQLGSVARGRSRHRPRNDPSLYGGQWPFFQTGDVKAANHYLRTYSQTYNDVGLAQSKLWPPGTLCITIAANIADTAILAIPGCFPDSVVGFIADPDKADARFIKYYIEILKQGMQNASQGTTQDNLSVDKLLTFDFLVPPASRQREIASILAAYDDLIENNTRRIAILEEMARCIYDQWFSRFARSEAGLIPEGWRLGNFGDVAKKASRKFYDEEHSRLPLIDLSRIPRRSNSLVEVGPSSEITTSRLVFRQGATLFGAIRPNFHKVLFAPFDGVSNVSVHVLEPKRPFGHAFLFCTAFADDTVSWAVQHAGGMKMPTIGWDVLATMPVVIPTEELLIDFERHVSPMLGLIATLVRQNLSLRTTRDLLLPKLISGELDVSKVPEPEPV